MGPADAGDIGTGDHAGRGGSKAVGAKAADGLGSRSATLQGSENTEFLMSVAGVCWLILSVVA